MVDDQAAATAIKSSDLLMLSTSGGLGAIKSQDFRNRIKRLFGIYGHKKIVVIVSDLSPKSAAKARSAILEFANDIYGTSGYDMPEGVVGAYLMPYSDEVQEQLKHPDFLPLSKTSGKKFEDFDSMLKSLPQKAAEIKNYTFERAVARVLQVVKEYERSQIMSHLTAQLYLAASGPVKRAAVREVQFQFPAARYLDLVINNSGHYSGFFGSIEEGYDYIFQKLLNPARLVRIFRPQADKPKQLNQFEAAHLQNSKEGIATLLVGLDKKGNLQVPRGIDSNPNEDLVVRASAFTRATGIKTVNLPGDSTSKKVSIVLPHPEHLPADVQEEAKKMGEARTTAETELTEAIKAAVLRGLNPDMEESVYVPRTSNEKNRARLFKAGSLLLSTAIIAAPAILAAPVVIDLGTKLIRVGMTTTSFVVRGFIASEAAAVVHEIGASREDRLLVERTEQRMKALVLPKIEGYLTDFSKAYLSALEANQEVPLKLIEVQGLLKIIDENFSPMMTRLN